MLNNYCVVVTGLPGSGKSTLGVEMAKYLGLPYFDKDEYLENLFDQRGIGDAEWRHALSREADEHFVRDSTSVDNAILISHWRPKGHSVEFGTPTEWLCANFSNIIELHCQCPVEIAAERFKKRKRHEGHVDELRSFEDVVDWLRGYSQYLPMGLGQQIVVDSNDSNRVQLAKEKLANIILGNTY